MPAAATNSLAIYRAIADGLDNSLLTTLIEMKRHRVRFDDPSVISPLLSIESLLQNANDGDFPRWVLWPADLSDAAYTAAPGFIDRSPSFNPKVTPWLAVNTERYRLSIVHLDQTLAAVSQNESDVLAALRALGPTLGLSYVKSWGKVTGSRYFGVTDLTGGSERFQTDLYIPVTTFQNGADAMP